MTSDAGPVRLSVTEWLTQSPAIRTTGTAGQTTAYGAHRPHDRDLTRALSFTGSSSSESFARGEPRRQTSGARPDAAETRRTRGARRRRGRPWRPPWLRGARCARARTSRRSSRAASRLHEVPFSCWPVSFRPRRAGNGPIVLRGTIDCLDSPRATGRWWSSNSNRERRGPSTRGSSTSTSRPPVRLFPAATVDGRLHLS